MPEINVTSPITNKTSTNNNLIKTPMTQSVPANQSANESLYNVNNNGTCSIKISGWVQADKRDNNIGGAPNFNDSSKNVKFTDTNEDGKIDKDDQVVYIDAKGREVTTKVCDMRRGYFPSQQDISLANGQRFITTITNRSKADAILNFEGSQVNQNGSSTKLAEAINQTNNNTDGKIYNLTNQYVAGIANMLSDDTNTGIAKMQLLTNELKISNPALTTTVPGSSMHNGNQFGINSFESRGSVTLLNLKGVRSIENPMLLSLQKRIERADMNENANWNSPANVRY